MVYIGMNVHQSSTTFCLFDPKQDKGHRYRTLTRPTTVEALQAVLRPFARCCRVAFEVGTQAQWIAKIVRPLAAEVQVANPSRIPWLFRDGRKNDAIDARKLATLLHHRPSEKNGPASHGSHVPSRIGPRLDPSEYEWKPGRIVRPCVRP